MRTVVAFRSDVGRVREGNEDSLLIQDPVFVVADGMGGHVAGDIASQTAIETITERTSGNTLGPDVLEDLIKAANAAIWDKAQSDSALRGMGTTCTLVLVDDSSIHIGHVGDSRAYLFREGELTQLTEDHTLVGRMVKEGRLQPEEAERHPQRNIITRTLGVDPEVQVDTTSIDVKEGDRILICSDGLTSMIDGGLITRVLADEADPQAAVDQLIDEANAAGGEDNVTVVIVEFRAGAGGMEATPVASTSGRDTTPTPAVAAPRVDTRPDELPDDYTQAVGVAAVPDPGTASPPRRKSRIARGVIATVLIVAVLAVGGVMIFRYAIVENSYFVGVNADGMVTIYQGLPDEVAGVTFKEEQESSSIALVDLPEFLRTDVEEGIEADSLQDAQETVANLEDRARDEEFEKPRDQDRERENP